MANAKAMAPELKAYKTFYDSNWSSVKSKKSDLCNDINDVKNQLDSALNGISSAIGGRDEAVGKDIKECLALAIDGVSRVKTGVDEALSAKYFSEGDNVRTEIITEIERYQSEISRCEGDSFWESAYNYTFGWIFGKIGGTATVQRANDMIETLNKTGKQNLLEMSNAINQVDFGVIGNMVHGGSLGNLVGFADNYTFNRVEWQEQNKVVTLTGLQQFGCAVVGAVEGVANVVEGVFDFATTVAAGVVSIFDKDAGDAMAAFAARDLSAEAAAAVMDATSGITGISGDAYLQSGGRKAGKTVGGMVAHGALWMTGAGAIISAVSVAGNATQTSLQSGNSIWQSVGTGAVVGLASYAMGHAAKALTTKFSAWATGKGSTTLVGKAYNGLIKYGLGDSAKFGSGWVQRTNGWGVKGIVTKAFNIALSPARGIANMMQGGAKLLNNSKLAQTGAWQKRAKLDAGVDRMATKVVNSVTSKVAAVGNKIRNAGGKVKNAVTHPGETVTNLKNSVKSKFTGKETAAAEASTPSATDAAKPTAKADATTELRNQTIANEKMMNSGEGSLGTDGKMQPPASQNGAPKNAADSAFSKTSSDVGVPVPKNSMSYNEAQHNLKMLEDMGFDPGTGRITTAPGEPFTHDELLAQELFHDSQGTVIWKIPYDSNVTLNQNGNWYQNAENAMKYVANNDLLGDWDTFTDAAYRLGRVSGYNQTQYAVNTGGTPPVTPVTPTGGTPPVTPVTPTGVTAKLHNYDYLVNGYLAEDYSKHVKNES